MRFSLSDRLDGFDAPARTEKLISSEIKITSDSYG